MKKTYKHIGYYNDIDDCKTLFTETADSVVESMKDNFGAFHSVDGDEETDVTWGDEPDMHLFFRTSNEQYLVRYERGNDKEGWFIDIYELRDHGTTPDDDSVEEYCGHCDTYVLLTDELKVQKCPNCGRAIVPCSICPMLEQDNYPLLKCSSCPLAKLCESANKEYDGDVYTPEEFIAWLNTLSSNQLALGMDITIPKDPNNDNSCVEKLNLHYNTMYDKPIVFLRNIEQNGLAFTWGTKSIPLHLFKDALFSICNRVVTRMYVVQKFV